MPVPMIAPIPRSVSSKGESHFFQAVRSAGTFHQFGNRLGLKDDGIFPEKGLHVHGFTGESLFIRFKGDVIMLFPVEYRAVTGSCMVTVFCTVTGSGQTTSASHD